MSAQSNVAPIIIKRKKVISGGGHHGGAWKVAYADFVTAMMAFFMMMWLLSATTEKQRKGLADYFSPTIPIARISGGGNGAFNGDSMFSEEMMAQSGIGASNLNPLDAQQSRGDSGVEQDAEKQAESEEFKTIEEALQGRGGESMISVKMAKHIVTRVTDEGLIIEMFATEGAPLFEEGREVPTQLLRDLMRMVARVTGVVSNNVAIGGYIRAHPIVLADNPVWELSSARADTTRKLLESGGMKPGRIHRVTGNADRNLAVENPMSKRNNRIEIVLLRR